MTKFNVVVQHTFETEIEVYAKNKGDAIRKIREIDMTTDIIPQSMYTEASTSYKVVETDEDTEECDCEGCLYFEDKECLFDELY